jgi:hypothetical protein
MAKKVRPRGEAVQQEPGFEFPVFDEAAYINKEYEITRGMAIAGLLAVMVGIASWAGTSAGLPWFVEVVFGFAALFAVYPVVHALHPRAHVFTKGDWAALFAVVFFGWLALWFMLLNLAPIAL